MCNMLEGGFTPMASLEELRDMGFHIVLHPLTGAGFIGIIRVVRLAPQLAGRWQGEAERVATVAACELPCAGP